MMTPAAEQHTRVHAVVVDDHPLFRKGIVQLLKETDGFCVLADFQSALDYIEQMDNFDTELLLLDLQMPDISGIEALKKIRAKIHANGGDMRIVMITASDNSEHLIEALSAGADGYLFKDTPAEEIAAQLQKVMAGEVALNTAGLNILAHGLRNSNSPEADTTAHPQATSSVKNTPADSADNNELTQREQQTLQLISLGMSNKLIARELGISDGTVKVYVKNMLRKLNLHSRLELAAWAYNNTQQAAGMSKETH